MFGGPLDSLRRHQDGSGHVLHARHAAEPGHYLSLAVSGQHCMPPQREDVSKRLVGSRPGGNAHVQRLEHMVGHQPAHVDQPNAVLDPGASPGGAKGPFFFLHSFAPVLTNGAVASGHTVGHGWLTE